MAMQDLHTSSNSEQPGRLHTFDILQHLLESVDTEPLDDLSIANPAILEQHVFVAQEPIMSEDCNSRWRNAWNFLRSESFVLTGIDERYPFRLTLSAEGLELLEDLLECRTNLHSPLCIAGDTSYESVNSNATYALWHPDVKKRVYRTIGVVPRHSDSAHLYFNTVRENVGTNGSYATASYSRRA